MSSAFSNFGGFTWDSWSLRNCFVCARFRSFSLFYFTLSFFRSAFSSVANHRTIEQHCRYILNARMKTSRGACIIYSLPKYLFITSNWRDWNIWLLSLQISKKTRMEMKPIRNNRKKRSIFVYHRLTLPPCVSDNLTLKIFIKCWIVIDPQLSLDVKTKRGNTRSDLINNYIYA